ncbi:MAG: hypothetical protein Q9159_003603 [Coniocarpon cinnabarinum]
MRPCPVGEPSASPTCLLDLLTNSIVLHQISPYLPVASRLALASVNTAYRDLLRHSPEHFRYTDLSRCRGAQVPNMLVDRGGVNWRSQRMDESLTEDDVYCGPLRGIFSQLRRRHALQCIHTLVLDGLAVPADLVQEIIADTNVRILSIREAQHLNHRKLMATLKYAVRPTRPQGTPRLKGLYVFGPKPTKTTSKSPSYTTSWDNAGVTAAPGAQIGAPWNWKTQDILHAFSFSACEDRWYQPAGRIINSSPELSEWAETLRFCEGTIAFDAVLCRGPRHDLDAVLAGTPGVAPSADSLLPPAIADIALGPGGCATCKKTLESPARYGVSPEKHLPLLDPPPLHSSSVRDAQRPHLLNGAPSYPPFLARCSACMTGRWCERCLK